MSVPISDSPDREIQLLEGDCLLQIPLLCDGTVQAVITSPPYAMQRSKKKPSKKGKKSKNIRAESQFYPGVLEKDYPGWMVSVFDAIRPKLTEDGSILVNIRSHVKKGVVSDYVLET